MKHFLVLFVVAGSLLAYSQTNQPTGEIRGTVTDPNGSPVSGAIVYAVPQGLILADITPRSAKTDRNGGFDFRGGFELASYKLYAKKLEDNYPDPSDSFYGDPKAEAPNVDLTQSHSSATVTVKLAAQSAVITGKIVDASTGAAIRALLGCVDSEGHGRSVTVNGSYRMLVPPGKDLTLMVTVLGPPTERAMIPFAPLRLEPGQYVNLDIPVSRN